jgi:transposase
VIARRQGSVPKEVIDIAWKAQLRLCARFRKLCARGVNRNKVTVAIARELCGFIWSVGQIVKPL